MYSSYSKTPVKPYPYLAEIRIFGHAIMNYYDTELARLGPAPGGCWGAIRWVGMSRGAVQ